VLLLSGGAVFGRSKKIICVMRQFNDAVSRHGINILAQYLQTDPEAGYAVLKTDVLGGEGEELLAELRGAPGTIRVRVLYDQGVRWRVESEF
jgi:hypothetical protein